MFLNGGQRQLETLNPLNSSLYTPMDHDLREGGYNAVTLPLAWYEDIMLVQHAMRQLYSLLYRSKTRQALVTIAAIAAPTGLAQYYFRAAEGMNICKLS